MFVREKRIGPYSYLYLVESVREDGKTRQRIIHTLGRKEDVERRGDLDRLVRSVARLAQRSMVLSLLDEGSIPELACKRIGPRCCSSGCGATPSAERWWTSCSPGAASSLRSSARCSSPCCIG